MNISLTGCLINTGETRIAERPFFSGDKLTNHLECKLECKPLVGPEAPFPSRANQVAARGSALPIYSGYGIGAKGAAAK